MDPSVKARPIVELRAPMNELRQEGVSRAQRLIERRQRSNGTAVFGRVDSESSRTLMKTKHESAL